MEAFFLWTGFLGAWFLFAGPIYQAALELQDEDIAVDRIRAAGSKVQPEPEVSSWWWLLPPVKFYKEFRREKQMRARIFRMLKPEDAEAMIAFTSKASAWLFVAFGGLCIAAKETAELTVHYAWGWWPLIAIIVLMFAVSIINLVYRLKRAAKYTTGQS